MLKSSFCNYIEPYMLPKGTISIAAQAGDNPNNGDEGVVLKNCAPFTDCIIEINNTQIDKAKDTDVVMSMYNLIEYRHNYLKPIGSLLQYYRDEPTLTDAGTFTNFYAVNNSASFKLKKITGKTDAANNCAIKIFK